MCLALPARVVSVDNDAEMATVALEGIKKQISISLVDDVQPEDYLLVHVGYALNKISPEEAERTLEMMREAGLLDEAVEEIAS